MKHWPFKALFAGIEIEIESCWVMFCPSFFIPKTSGLHTPPILNSLERP